MIARVVTVAGLCLALAAGCASGPARVAVTHSPLDPPQETHGASLRVRALEDARLQQLRRFVGSEGREPGGAPPGWDMAIMVEGGTPLGAVLADHVTDALRAAGYTAAPESKAPTHAGSVGRPDAIVAGRIEVFWLNREPPVSWMSVALSVRLLDASSQESLWQRSFEGLRTKTVLFPKPRDHEALIRATMDDVVREMVGAFSSVEFQALLRASR